MIGSKLKLRKRGIKKLVMRGEGVLLFKNHKKGSEFFMPIKALISSII